MIISTNPLLNVILFSLFWATKIVLVKYILNTGVGVPPLLIIVTSIGLIVMLGVVCTFDFKSLVKCFRNKKILACLLGIGAVQYGFGTLLSTSATAYTSAINIGFLSKISSVYLVFLAAVFLKEELTKTKLITLAISLLGVWLLVTKGSSIYFNRGDILILLAALFWSIGNVLLKIFMKSYTIPPNTVSLFRPISFLLLLPLFFSLWSKLEIQVDFTIFNSCQSLVLPVLLGVINALVWVFLNRSLHYCTASYMTLMSMLTPVIVVALSFVFLGEAISLIQIIGGALIITGTFLTAKKVPQKAK